MEQPSVKVAPTGVEELHQRAFVIDGLSDTELTAALGERMRRGGITAANHTLVGRGKDIGDVIANVIRTRRLAASHSEYFRIVESAADIEEAKEAGKTGIIMGMQSPRPIEDRPEYIEALQRLGVRIIQLSRNDRTLMADGCLEPSDGGLSLFGRRAVRELNRLNVLIDVSHCGYRSTREAIEASEAPVAATHANPTKVSPNPRNKPDDVLKALAERGGVAGICVWSPLLHRNRGRQPGLEDLVYAIDYTVELIGIDHVGLGSDHEWDVSATENRPEWRRRWANLTATSPEVVAAVNEWGVDYETQYASGLSSPDEFPNVTRALLERGYGADDVLKILGGNFLRLFRQVWKG